MARKRSGARRAGKIKVDHSIIDGLRTILERVEAWPEVGSIIPGRIKPSGSHHAMRLEVQYKTPSGLKAIAKGNGGVQEVFFVSNSPDLLAQKLNELEL